MGKKGSGGIFANWLKHFTTMVFMQSFHAIFMMMILKFMDISSREIELEISLDEHNDDILMAIIAIFGMLALLKMEKLIKNLFGIEDSKLVGGLGENLTKSMAQVRSAISLSNRTLEPDKRQTQIGKDNKAASKKVDRATTKYNRVREMQEFIKNNEEENTLPQLSNNIPAAQTDYFQQDASSNSSGKQTSIITGQEAEEFWNNRGKEQNKSGSGTSAAASDEALKRLVAALENNTNALSNNTNTVASNGSGVSGSANSRINAEESKIKNNWELQDAENELKEAQEELAQLERDEQIAKKQKYTRLMTTVAALGVGLGATENLGDAITFANLADMPMDWATDKMVSKSVNLDYS